MMDSDNETIEFPLRELDLTSLPAANHSLPSPDHSLPIFDSTTISLTNSIRYEQLNSAFTNPSNELLNEIEKRPSITSVSDLLMAQSVNFITFIKKLQLENENLKATQAASHEKSKHLETCQALIKQLQKECNEKDKFIEKLQVESVEKVVQLQSKLNEINELQEVCNSKDAQLVETMKLVEKLQTECIEKDIQAKASFDRWERLGESMHDSNELIDALFVCGSDCWDQKKYAEALVHWKNAIGLEKRTQNRSRRLALLFANKSGCYNCLKQYQESIDAATTALYYNSNDKFALNNRASAYIALKQYHDARKDLEKALKLDPTYEEANNNLELLQEHVNASNFQ